MAKSTLSSVPATGEARVAKLNEFQESVSPQLSFFELLSVPDHQRYSNTIELYDFIPKYVWGKVERIQGEFLRPLEREFECKKRHYKVTVTPARIKGKDGVYRDHFPSKREELVEDALRKFATEGKGVMLDELASVKFTLNQLQQELKANGHSYSKDELKESIFICAGTHLKVTSEDGTAELMSSMFETIGLQSRDDWKANGRNASAFVRFNSLVTRAIKNRAYRIYNYETSMRYSSSIARQLHKRLSHHYKQASFLDPRNYYSINLSTIIRDFGLTQYEWLSHNLKKVEIALEEMKAQSVIMDYKIEKRETAGGRKKLQDAKITIIPSADFVREVKKANWQEDQVNAYPAALPSAR